MALKLIPPGARKGNPYYLAIGWHNGRYIERSLKTKDPEEAEEAFVDLRRELRRQSAASFTFADAVDLYRQTRVVDKQLDRWLRDLVAQLGKIEAAKITNVELHRAALKLYPRAAPATRNRQVIVPAASVLHYAAEANRIPWLKVRKFKEPEAPPRFLSREQAEALIAGAETPEQRALLLFLFVHGWRITEALRLQWAHIDLVEGTIMRHSTKTNSWSVLALAPSVAEAFQELMEPNKRVGRVFPWRTRFGVYRWLRPLCRRLNIPFTPHQARHSFATWAVNDEVGTLALMEVGGWRDVKSVRRYGRVSRAQQAAVVNRGLGKSRE